MSEEEFLNHMELEKDYLESLEIKTEELLAIYEDFETKKDEFKIFANSIASILREHPKAHSVRSRVKDSKSLINKIVRKTKEKYIDNEQDEKVKITKDNYLEMLNDLIGVRILHIFKQDWPKLHDFIIQKWESLEIEANIRKGDNSEIFEDNDIEIINRDTGYRSVHYVIEMRPINEKIKAEIQVRTIFEEGYGEIDHYIRYPDKQVDPYIEAHLLLLNRLAGSTDEMGSYTKNLHINLEEKKAENREQKNNLDNLKGKIADLEKKLNQKEDINTKDLTQPVGELSDLLSKVEVSDLYYTPPIDSITLQELELELELTAARIAAQEQDLKSSTGSLTAQEQKLALQNDWLTTREKEIDSTAARIAAQLATDSSKENEKKSSSGTFLEDEKYMENKKNKKDKE